MRPADGELLDLYRQERRALRRAGNESARSQRHRLKREKRRRNARARAARTGGV